MKLRRVQGVAGGLTCIDSWAPSRQTLAVAVSFGQVPPFQIRSIHWLQLIVEAQLVCYEWCSFQSANDICVSTDILLLNMGGFSSELDKALEMLSVFIGADG